jgi:hypothetical protein
MALSLRLPAVAIALWLAPLAIAQRSAISREPPALSVVGLGKATVSLDGLWQFRVGDDPEWASPEFDDSTWQPIEVGRTWEEQGHRDYTGFAWYRRRIVLANIPADAQWQLALALPSVEDAGEVYWNGRLVGSYGKLPPGPVWYPGLDPLTRGLGLHNPAFVPLGRPQSGVLAIRVWTAPYVAFSFPNLGGLTVAPLLGSEEALASLDTVRWYSWLRASLWQMSIGLLSGVVALLALLVLLRDRRQRILLWLALYTIHPLAQLLIFRIPGMSSFRWSYALICPFLAIEDISLWYLLLYLLGLRDNPRLVRWTWWMAAIAFVCYFGLGAIRLFNWTTWPDHAFLTLDVGLTVPPLLVEAWGVVLVLFAFSRPLDAARWFLAIAAMLANLSQVFANWSSFGVRWTHQNFWVLFDLPLFSVLGNRFDAISVLDSLLLVAIIYAVWRYQAEQTQQQNRLSEEFRNAQEVQRLLVPESMPELPGYSVSSAYKPAMEVGGDFFQIIPEENGETVIVLGDVSGKGLKAAMAVSLIVGLVRALAPMISDPGKLLAEVNERLFGRLQGGFATALALRLDAQGNCDLACAGHLPPFVNGEEIDLPGAFPLGIANGAAYDTVHFQLRSSDRLALFTDGLLEARSGSGELYGFERMQTLFATKPTAAQATQAAVEFGQDDDITVLILTRLGIGEESISQPSAPVLSPGWLPRPS